MLPTVSIMRAPGWSHATLLFRRMPAAMAVLGMDEHGTTTTLLVVPSDCLAILAAEMRAWPLPPATITPWQGEELALGSLILPSGYARAWQCNPEVGQVTLVEHGAHLHLMIRAKARGSLLYHQASPIWFATPAGVLDTVQRLWAKQDLTTEPSPLITRWNVDSWHLIRRWRAGPECTEDPYRFVCALLRAYANEGGVLS